MKRICTFTTLLLLAWGAFAQQHFDVVIVGGNPGGIMAAIAAARQGKTSVILERTRHIGGLPANGLGATDIATRQATTGLFLEFTSRVRQYYADRYGANSRQVTDCSDGFHFEPSVAATVYQDMLDEHKDKITVLLMRQFDAELPNISVRSGRIESIRILNRENGEQETYRGNVFVDATYEGDLGAAAGVPFRIGREGKAEFDEPGAGRTYEYWKSLPAEGSTGEADNAVQAYNYRLCLTNDPDNRLLFPKPVSYNRDEYVSLIEDVWTGKNTQRAMLQVTEEMMEENRCHIAAGHPTRLAGDSWGIGKLSNMVKLPNRKTDGNNQHAAFISTDLPEENWQWRDRFAQRLKEYTLGLLWFAQNDEALPKAFRDNVREWGLAKDEYIDNGNFPRQVYVREGRRLHGEHFFTANDAYPVAKGKRPPLYSNSITASHYALDSHAVHKREKGKIALDGFFNYQASVYTVPFGVILPKKVNNLLIPVPASATHVGFSTLRMEPCWMALGQAAGIVAALAIEQNKSVKELDIEDIQAELLKEKATLMYFKDITVDSPDFEMVQYMGLRGYITDWVADLDRPMDRDMAKSWSTMSGITIEKFEGKSRRDILQAVYDLIR